MPDIQNDIPDTGLACLLLLMRLHGIAGEAEAVRHQLGKQGERLSATDLVRAARHLGLRARTVTCEASRLGLQSLPAIAGTLNGDFFIIAKANTEGESVQYLIQDPRQPHPSVMDHAQLISVWDGQLILLTRRAGLVGQLQRFDARWFVPALLKYKKLFRDVLIASFFLQIFGLITPLFFQIVIDKVLVHHGLTTLDVLVFGLVVVNVFETILGVLRTYVFAHTTNRVDVGLGAGLFHHLLALPLSYFGARRVGDSAARVRELENIRDFLTGSALTLVIDTAFTVVFLIVMYYYSPTLTWIVLASIPCFVVLSLVVTPVLRSRVEEKFARGAERQAFLVESITGVETLKSMAVEPQMQRRWEEQLAAYVSASFRASNLNAAAGQVAQLISKITTALTIYFGARLVIDGDLSVGQLVAFNMLAGRVNAPVLRLAQLWQDFQQARISVDRLGDILNTPTEPVASPSRAALPRIDGRVQFEYVTFRYRPDGQQILKGVTLEFLAGQVIGIVGPSGSGKSTLAKLLQRLYIPETGRVLVDGIDLAMVDPAWLRRQIGVVLQENLLFNNSIRENIALVDPGMDMARVIEAAKLAGAHEFILQLPEGYDTIVGERGASLSGGQRQRIAIARALVNNPRILVFDEATSALDYESEHAIQANMRRICQGRTVIIIAHRLAAVRNCDRIVTIENGTVVEDGNHQDLIRQNGRYASFYRHQTGEATDA